MSEPIEKFPQAALRAFVDGVYRTAGLDAAGAARMADTLVQADLWGHPSHGVMRTFWYVARIQSGAINLVEEPEYVSDAGAVALLDGKDGLGQAIAERAMRSAVDRARRFGVGVVSVRNSGHFGTAMYFTRIAAEAGCVGLLTTNASPAMAPWGGKEKRIGNNPWSIAAPTPREAPMVLDIANTVVARGKIHHARERGDAIPEGWAIGSDGAPTTDAAAALAGVVLPMAAHKGYAISTMMDVLSGVLSGGAFATDVVGPYVAEKRSGAGHLAIALNIAAFRPLDAFLADMGALIETLKTTPRAPGVDEIFYPGEIEARREAQARVDGAPVPADTLAALRDGAAAIGAPPLDHYLAQR